MATQRNSNAHKGGRRCWPPNVLDTENWPGVDASVVPQGRPRKRYLVLQDAVSGYVAGRSLHDCLNATRLKKRRFLELVARCVSRHDDGRIWGFRALVYGAPVKERMRTADIRPGVKGMGGHAGAFKQHLAKHPGIGEGLIEWLLRRGKASFRPTRTLLHSLHFEHMRLCAEQGLTNKDYPLSTQNKGRRALWKWHKGWFLKHYASRFIGAEHGKDAKNLWDYAAEGDGEAARVYSAYEAWVLDGFTVDLRNKVCFQSKSLGWYDVETSRLMGLRVADTVSGANLAHKLVFGMQISANDVLEVICDAVLGSGKLRQALKCVVLEEGAGFPSEVIEALRFAVPLIIYLDNALAHLADSVEFALLGILGCEIKFGQFRTPRERGAIEAKYRTQALYFLHQMLGTTGSGPHDPARKIADVDASKLLDADVLAWALAAYVQNENCLPNAAAGYISALDFLRRSLRSGNCAPQLLPPHLRKRYFFCEPKPVRVYMDVERGRPPEIHYMYATYRSTVLNKRTDLWKKWLTVRYDVRSLRTIMLFNEDGTEFGPIQAIGKWARFPHSMWFRQLYGRLKNKKLLGPRPESRPLHAVYDYLRNEAVRDKRAALLLAAVQDMLLVAGGPDLAKVDESIAVEFAEWETIAETAETIRVAPMKVPPAKSAAKDPVRVARRAQSVDPVGLRGRAPAAMPSAMTLPPGWTANRPLRVGAWKPVRR